MKPNFVILYVTDPQKQADFYASLLGLAALQVSPTFAMLKLNGDTMLGLWKADTVLPKPSAGAGGQEIAVSVSTPDSVDAAHALWTQRGIPIAQAPTTMDFGRTCVGLDPDGHRIRVMCAA